MGSNSVVDNSNDNVGGVAFEQLPLAFIFDRLRQTLDARTLALLSCCNRDIHFVASANGLWEDLCTDKGWVRNICGTKEKTIGADDDEFFWEYDEDFHTCATAVSGAGGREHATSWHALFCSKQNSRCRACATPTQYVFILLPDRPRLCERCEQAIPAYGLISKKEALQRYKLDPEDISGLMRKSIAGRAFFMRGAVEQAMIAKHGLITSKGKHIVDGLNEVESESSDQEEDKGCRTGAPQKYTKGEDERLEDEGNSDNSCAASPGNLGKSLDEVREMRRELRKEHKKQVKAANRESRALRSEGLKPHSPSAYHLKASPKASNSSKGRGSRSREHRQKQPSEWVKEREWLEEEVGQFGFSALELA
eukprot:jgi/Mesen1/8397/ME000468S07834